MTWDQVFAALKGDLCDDFDVLPGDVSALFLLVGKDHLRDASKAAAAAGELDNADASSLIEGLLRVKQDELEFVRWCKRDLEEIKLKQTKVLGEVLQRREQVLHGMELAQE
jgi:hypothetical protein